MDRDPARFGVVAGGGEVPVALEQRLADRHRLHRAIRHAEPERDGAGIVDDQREAGAGYAGPTW